MQKNTTVLVDRLVVLFATRLNTALSFTVLVVTLCSRVALLEKSILLLRYSKRKIREKSQKAISGVI